MDKIWQKVGVSVLIVLLVAGVFFVNFSLLVDEKADQHLKEVMKRGIIVFAIARGINGAVSVLQSTEVSASLGVGVNVGVGEVLDPINDLVESFSSIMLLSNVSVGTQLVLLKVGSWIGLKIILAGAAVIALLGIWIRTQRFDFGAFGLKVFFLFLAFRFLIPVTAWISESTYRSFLETTYQESTGKLETMSEEMKPEGLPNGSTDQGWMDKAKGVLDLKKKIDQWRGMIGDFSRHVINLIVVFLVQTILIPLGVLWGTLYFVRAMARSIRPLG